MWVDMESMQRAGHGLYWTVAQHVLTAKVVRTLPLSTYACQLCNKNPWRHPTYSCVHSDSTSEVTFYPHYYLCLTFFVAKECLHNNHSYYTKMNLVLNCTPHSIISSRFFRAHELAVQSQNTQTYTNTPELHMHLHGDMPRPVVRGRNLE